MRALRSLFAREFLGYFRSPIAYVFLVVFVLLGVGLPWFLDGFLDSDEASLQSFFRFLPWLNVLFVPAVGMRLWAEERNSGTWELLLTLPLSTGQAVLGKFLAGWAFVGAALAATFAFPLTAAYLGRPDWGPIAAGYLMAFLMSGSVLAVCSLMSALTQNQVIAFVLGVLACLVLSLTGWDAFNGLLRGLPVGWADAVANFGFTTHFEAARQGLVRLPDAVFFLSVAAGALWANRVVLERAASAGSRLRQAGALALLAVAVLAANDAAARLPMVQADLTRERLFTLSEGSAAMLARMERPVQVELYFSASREGVPIGLKIFAQRVEELLRQYARRSGGRLTVRSLDPVPGSPEEDEARRLGLAAQPFGPDQRLYFGLAVFQGGNRRVIPLIDLRRERLLEYDLSRLIQAVQEPRLPKLALVSSVVVLGKRGMPERLRRIEDGTAEWQFVKDLRVSYDLEDVAPTAATLPADADCALVINPSGFDPRLLHAIDQFVLAGKPAVVLVDPYCYHETVRRDSSGVVLGEEYHVSSDAAGFLAKWGIGFDPGEVVGDPAYATEVPLAKDQAPIRFPLWLTVRDFDDAEPVAAGFDRVLLPYAGSFSAVAGAPVTLTPLVRASPAAGSVPVSRIGAADPRRFGELIKPDGRLRVLAALVEGRFSTAYPGGKPAPPPGQMAAAEADPWDLGLKASAGTSRVIVIGDCDFLDDAMAYQLVGRSGDTLLTKPRNDDVALLLNSLDSLRGSLGRLPVRARAGALRPFTRVHELRRSMEAQSEGRVRAINERMDQLAAQMAELNREAAEGGGSLVSEKALTAIRRLEREQAGLRAEQAELRQRLEAAVRSLGRRLTFVNLALVPGLIGLGGLGFWVRRSRGKAQS